MDIEIKFSDFKKIIKEDIEGYQPRIDKDVEDTEAKQNKDSYKLSAKRAEDSTKAEGEEFDPIVDVKDSDYDRANNIDGMGMERLKYDYPLTKDTKDRIQAQIMGKDSSIQEDIDDEKSAVDTKGNAAFFKKDGVEANEFDNDHTGLGKNNAAMVQMGDNIFTLTDGTKPATKHSAFSENTDKMKRLNFKQTLFLGENHIFSLIPESYKTDGNKFLMKDKDDNEYLIEWKVNQMFNTSNAVILEEKHDKLVNESIDKIKHLFNYKTSSTSTTNKIRLNEDKNFVSLTQKARELTEDGKE